MAKKIVCVDLGTTQTRVWVSSKGNIFDEPTAMALDSNGKVLEIGVLADRAAGRSPKDVTIFRLMKDGVVADVDLCASFIWRIFANQNMERLLRGAIVLVSCPNDMTSVEKNALFEVFERVKVSKTILEPSAKMAALGAGIDMSSPRGILVLDIGGGSSDCAAVAMGSIAVSHTVKVGGRSFDSALIRYCKNSRNLVLGPQTAETCKMRICSLSKDAENQFYEVRGRDVSTGLPSSCILSTSELRPALLPLAQQICEMVAETVQDVKPELAADLVRSGVLVSGAGAQMGGMKEFLSTNLRMPIHFAADMPNGTMLGLQRQAKRLFGHIN